MTTQRKTYASREEQYNLRPAKLFNIIADLETYMALASFQAVKENPSGSRPATSFIGNGRKLLLETEVSEPPFLIGFTLAEIVLSADGDSLLMKINAHPSVAIPSEDLHCIGMRYKRK